MSLRILLSVDSSQGVDTSRKYYTDAVEAAGSIAVAEYCPDFSLDYDGLLLRGGCDMAHYGEPINGRLDIDHERDEIELRLTDAFIHTSLPVLGVQWHPEKLCCSMRRDDAVDGMPLFSYFLSLCKGACK